MMMINRAKIGTSLVCIMTVLLMPFYLIGQNCTGIDQAVTFQWTPTGLTGATGIAEKDGCDSFDAVATYSGTATVINGGGNIETRLQGNGALTDIWTVDFDAPLTNPVICITELKGAATVEITDCGGNVLVAGVNNGDYTLTGTFSCIMITVNTIGGPGDRWTFAVKTCTPCPPPAPPVPCVACAAGTFEYISLANSVGSGTGATADIMLDGVCYGKATALYSNMSVREDLKGTKFGGVANGKGTEENLILHLEFCAPIDIQQVDVVEIESQSIVWVGTGITGTGALPTDTPVGVLASCGTPTANMTLNGNMITNTTTPSCLNQGSGIYQLANGNGVTDLYFKYQNPAGGCSLDGARFKIGACVPELSIVTVSCPLEEVTLELKDESTITRLRDGMGNYFDASCGFGSLQSVRVSPCAEVVDIVTCPDCLPEPVCTTCPADTEFGYISLDATATNALGHPTGTIELGGVKIGTYDFVESNVTVLDGNGITFGGAHRTDPLGTFLLELSFCEPLTIAEMDIIGLEVESQVSVGTAPDLSGMDLMYCSGSSRMDADDITGGNTVTTAGPGCLANPDATYQVTPSTVSTMYFRYTNPNMGCTRDRIKFRIGACYLPLEDAIPTCPLTLYTVDECPDDPANATFDAIQDGNGNWFSAATCGGLDPIPTTAQTRLGISPCATFLEKEVCPQCVIPGLRKQVTDYVCASSGITGNVDATFKFTLTNSGDADMINLQINDNLAGLPGFVGLVAGPTVTMDSGTPATAVANGGYNGIGNLLNGSSGNLSSGETVMVTVVVEMDPSSIPPSATNTATGGGTAIGSPRLFLDGSHLDADYVEDGLDNDNNTPTPLLFVKSDMNKGITSVLSSGIPGEFWITYSITYTNHGNIPLKEICLNDDLAGLNPAAYQGVIQTPGVVISAGTATTPPTANAGYNGSSQINLTDCSTGLVDSGQSFTVTFTALYKDPIPNDNVVKSTATACGPDATGEIISASSPSAESLFSSAAVPHGECSTIVCNDNIQISLDANCSMDLHNNGDIFGEGDLHHKTGVEFSEPNGDFIGGILDASHIGKTLPYKLHDLCNGNTCWGTATIEANIVPDLDLDCAYVPEIHEEKEVTIVKGETMAMFTMDILPDECQLTGTTVTVSGDAKYECAEGNDGLINTSDDGWCTVECKVTWDSNPLSPNYGKVTVTIPDDAPVDVICKVKIHAPDCIDPDCITWCPGGEIDEEDIAKLFEDACLAKPEEIFKTVTEFGDQCDGLTRLVKYSTIINQHGEDILVDLGTQAFKVEPVSIFAEDPATGDLVCNLFNDGSDPSVTFPATGSGVLVLPAASVSLNCDQDADDLSLTGQPMILNHHEPSTATPCSAPITVHYKVVTEILEDQPVDVDGVWVLLDVLKKETKEVVVCDCADIQPVLDAYTGSKAKVGDVFEIITPIPGVDVAKGTCTEKDLHAVTRPPVTVPYTPYTLDELAAYSCNTTLYTVEDVGEFPACGSGRKFLRQWTLIDWCNGKRKEFTQVIEVKDTKAPVILADEDDLAAETVSTEPWVCSAAIEADGSAFFSDECSDYRVEIEVTDKATGIWIDPSAVGVGTYTVSYVAVDECGNKTKAITKDYVVVDNVKPVPVCEDELVVSVTDDNAGDGGLAKIYAADFNAGSHDAGCGPVTGMKVVRMEDWNVTPVSCDPFTDEIETTTVVDKFGTEETTTELVGIMGDHVKFCCSDVGNENIVVLRVYDAAGNHNDCMVRVTVQNKLTATCEDVVVDLTCLTYSGNPADYNKPGGAGSECTNTALTLVDEQVSINSCGVGKVITYYALEGTGALCKQTINITADGAFDPTSIRWPFHYDDNTYTAVRKELDTRAGSATEGECIENGTEEVSLGNLNCGDDQPICEPTWTDASCGLVGVSVKEEIIEFDANACYKIIKRWTVVDWCTWEANDGSENFDDENDTDRDVFEPCANWCEEDCNRYFFRYADGQVDVDGYYTFDQVIKVVDTEAPTVTCTIDPATLGADCTADITFSASATDGAGCPSSTITYSWTLTDAAGRTVKTGTGATGAMSNLTDGEYTVTYVAADGCGNSSSTTCTIDLVDTKAPTPICYQSLSTAVMAGDDPSVEIWASDYLKEGSDNCPGDLIASFSGTEAVTNMTFTCDDVTGADIEMKVWLWDAAGNADYCFVTIRVDDNGHCGEIGSSAMIAGNIATEYGDDVAEADVMLNSVHPEFPAMRKTQNDGHYAFGGTPLTYDYEISAERNDDYMNGVSTLDLVLIQKHILGLATLDSPYKVIAADINSDQKVSGADLVQLRQLILGVTSELPANDSWRFVDAAQSFATSTSPWPFTEFIDIAALSNSMMTEDFVGVKIGDVNANAQANSLMSAEVRSNGTLNLNITDAAVNAGDLVSVDVTADNFSEVFGYQLTMNHPGLTLKSVEGVALEVTDANLGVREGVLTMSWNDTEGVTASGVLFTLNFNASTALQLSETISINSRITTAEAYVGAELANNDIELTFTNGENTIAAAEYNLYQNEPNPFRAYTDVSFVLPTSGQATISVIDVTGKVVTTVKDQFNKGLNTVRFTKSELGAAAGILYYQLESGEFTATKKMIILN